MKTLFLRSSFSILIALPTATACVSTKSSSSSPVSAIFAVLQDSIRRGGEVTRVVAPPIRGYQRPAPPETLDTLSAILGQPRASHDSAPVRCSWAPNDSTSSGMDITVTEFEVVGDSAMVSVLRECRQSQRGRIMLFESEPTWFLKLRDGRWVVTAFTRRITDNVTLDGCCDHRAIVADVIHDS